MDFVANSEATSANITDAIKKKDAFHKKNDRGWRVDACLWTYTAGSESMQRMEASVNESFMK